MEHVDFWLKLYLILYPSFVNLTTKITLLCILKRVFLIICGAFLQKLQFFLIFFFRCANNAMIGMPHKITTVDKFQGQQNDYILLSLVRTRNIGHLRYASKAFFFLLGGSFNDYVDMKRGRWSKMLVHVQHLKS